VSAIFQLYNGKNILLFDEMRMTMPALYQVVMLKWSFTVLAHLNV